MDHYHIEKPDVSGLSEPEVMSKYLQDYMAFYPYLQRVNETEYLYWTDVKRKPRPEGMSAEEFWVLVKLVRKLSARPLPVHDPENRVFTWYRQENLEPRLHRIDMELGGQMITSQISADQNQKFIARGILEEAIASSQLEGANTTRRVAKKMIAEQRPPRNKSEHMIYNNYLTMRAIEEGLSMKALSEELLLDLHTKLSTETMEAADIGRFRVDADEIVVTDRSNYGLIMHVPPPQSVLNAQLTSLIAYANDEEGAFIHPVVKAVVLHFWVAYLHPFTDGNGRVARALFYWYLLKKKYWMLAYVPVSTIIKRAPRQYSDAYVFAEQDDRDATYFISYHVEKLIKAMDELKEYVTEIDSENRQMDVILGPQVAINERQKQLLHYLAGGQGGEFATITTHQTLNGISRLTADRDLKDLVSKKLVSTVKVGRTIHFFASDHLKQLIVKKYPAR